MELKMKCLQLDLARQKENFDYIKHYFEFALKCGYDTVMIYLENIVKTEDTAFFKDEESYSVREMAEIVEYAHGIGLELIPYLQNLSYLEKFFKYDELKHFSEGEGRFGGLSGTACLCKKDEFYPFIDKYIKDVVNIFKYSKYVNMGFDEQFDLALCDDCKKKLAAGETKDGMFLEHVLRTNDLINSLGKTMLMWDDWFEYADIVEKLPRNIILLSWHYVFMSDEPNGHWVNRIKKDWYAYYDRLGFKYVMAVYAHRASSVYNVDTFTNYAAKHNPFGAITTVWCRSDSFYEGAYPFIAYAGALWNGRIKSEEDRLAVFSELLGGDRETARLVLALNIIEVFPNFDPLNYGINDTIVLSYYRNTLALALEKLREGISRANGLAKDIVTDIYDFILEVYMNTRLCKLSEKIFDNYDGKVMNLPSLVGEAEEIAAGYEEIRQNGRVLWAKYRQGIESRDDCFEKKFSFRAEKLRGIIEGLKRNEKKGVLFINYTGPEFYNTVKNKIVVKCRGEEEKEIFSGSIKPLESLFEYSGIMCVRITVPDKELEYVKFYSYGEGPFYPQHFRYYAQGKKFVASGVKVLEGNVTDAEKLLYDDSRFAVMGSDDGKMYYNDIDASRRMNAVQITFAEL